MTKFGLSRSGGGERTGYAIYFPDKPRAELKGQIVSVSRSEKLGGIPLEDRNELVTALSTYRSCTYDYASQVIEAQIVRTKPGDSYPIEFGYHESIEIEIPPGGLKGVRYIFSPSNEDASNRLAKELKTDRVKLNNTVKLEFKPTDEHSDQFEIDMDSIAGRLTPVFGNKRRRSKRISGQAIADHFMSRTKTGFPVTEPFVVGEIDDLKVELSFGRVGNNTTNGDGQRRKLWTREGNVLSGKLASSYIDDTTFIPPSLELSVVDKRSRGFKEFPVIDPARKAKMQEIAKSIEDAFAPEA